MKLVVQVTRLDQYHNGWCPLPCSNSGSLRHHLDSSLGWPRVDSVMKKATYFGVNQTIQIYGYFKGISLITMHFLGLVSYSDPCWDERLDDFVEFHKDEAIVSIVESQNYCQKEIRLSFFHSEGWLLFPTELKRVLTTCTKARHRTIWKSAKSRCMVLTKNLESLFTQDLCLLE